MPMSIFTSHKLKWLTGLAFLVLTAWCVSPGFNAAQDKQDLPIELGYIDPDAFGFVHVRFADLLQTGLAKQVQEQIPQGAALVKELEIDNTESATLVFSSEEALVFLMQGRFHHPRHDDFTRPRPPFEGNVSIRRVPGVLAIITLFKVDDKAKAIEQCAGKEAKEVNYKGKSIFVSPGAPNFAVSFLSERTIVVGPLETQKKLFDRPPQTQPEGPHAAALKLVLAKQPVVVGLNFTDPKMQLYLKELTTPGDNLPREPTWLLAPLVPMRSMALSLQLNEDHHVQLRASLSFVSPEKAVAGMDVVQDLLALGRILGLGSISHHLRRKMDDADNPADLMYWHMLIRQIESAARNTTVGRNQSTVLVQAQGQFDLNALHAQAKIEAAKLVPDEALLLLRARKQTVNHLKQIMLSFHFANDAHRQLPPAAICSKIDGTPLLSWRVALLPFIEEDALYRQFKLDEPWDSEHNIKLLPRIPKVYAPVGVKTKEPYSTFFQVFTGPDTPFDIKPDKNTQYGAVAPAIPRTFLDGTSNTIGVVEAFEPVPWTKPADLPYDAKKPLPKLGGLNLGGFHVGLMDGSVRFFAGVVDKEGAKPSAIPRGFITQETLRLAINPRDGMPLGRDW